MRKEKLWIEQGAVIQAVTGKNLRLTCYVDRPAAAGTMMYMYWEAPESVPVSFATVQYVSTNYVCVLALEGYFTPFIAGQSYCVVLRFLF